MKNSKKHVLFFLLIMILTLLSGCSCKTAAKNQKLVLNEVARPSSTHRCMLQLKTDISKKKALIWN